MTALARTLAAGERLSAADVEILRERLHPRWCDDCQRPHDKADRQRVLRRLLPRATRELREVLVDEFPCLYVGELFNDGAAGRTLLRDLHEMGAQLRLEPIGTRAGKGGMHQCLEHVWGRP